MTFPELDKLLPIKNEESFFNFLDLAFRYRLNHREISSKLAPYIYNNCMKYLYPTKESYILPNSKHKSTMGIDAMMRTFVYLDYIPRGDMSDEAYRDKVDSEWEKSNKLFLREKERRAL